jgi:hypothetical protein
MLHNDRHRRVDDLEQLHESEFPVAQGEIFYDRLSFSLHGQRSEVGLAIYALSQTPCGHLVVFEQDGTSYGEDVQSLIEPLAAVVAARYRLHPDTTRWASLTTRESGLLTRDRETYALYTLVHDPTCERYTNTCMETFYCLHDVFRALHRH